ncbi:FAM200B [Cordylochernes scorpioides]|uniref:FAM200B n=1 Tax=Cordylochernes scorpioides TaxID=51811 RepID=A0ABY6LJE8_9ARAC|nr:FAM200B [Cordylochernes scorpioides]
MVPSKLLRHIETNHREQMNNPISYFENIRSSFQKQSKKFKKFMTTSDEAQTASYMIAQLIARKKKAHAEAEEIILPALKIVAGCMLTNDAMEKVTKIPLSSKTIARRIEDMSEDIELQIKQSFNDSSTKWAIQLDETTDISNKAQLLAFLRFVDSGKIMNNYFFCEELKQRTTGVDIFELVDENVMNYERFKKGIDSTCHKKNPNIKFVHCMIHREMLVSKSVPPILVTTLDEVVKVVNYIKSNALRSRIFSTFCEAMDSDYKNLLFHTEVRWLSKGKVLNRFISMKNEIMAFIDNEEINFPFMMSDVWWLGVSFLGDIFDKLNSLNLNLQGAQENIITISTKLKAFKEKLSLWNLNIAKENFASFPMVQENPSKSIIKKEVEETLTLLSASFDKYFPYLDVEKMEWVVIPFMHCEIQHLEEEMQENLIDLKIHSCCLFCLDKLIFDLDMESLIGRFQTAIIYGKPDKSAISQSEATKSCTDFDAQEINLSDSAICEKRGYQNGFTEEMASKNEDLQMKNRIELYQLKMNQDETVDDYVNRAVIIKSRSIEAGDEINDRELICFALEGHISKECRNKIKCFNRGGFGHKSTVCKKYRNEYHAKYNYNGPKRGINKQNYKETTNHVIETNEDNYEEEEQKEDKIRWTIDSGASSHMVSKKELFIEYEEDERIIATAEKDATIKSSGIGSKRMNENKAEVIDKNGEILYEAKRLGDKFEVEGILNMEIVKKAEVNDILWHQRLAHVNFQKLKEMYDNSTVSGLKNLNNIKGNCESCTLGKIHRKSYKSIQYKQSENILDLWHTDIVGPLNNSFGYKYFITIVDDYSNFTFVIPIANKSQTADSIINLIIQEERQTGKKLKRIRNDNGGEYVSNYLKRWLSSKGIKQEFTTAYTPESNGKAERFNRTKNQARTMLIDSKLPIKIWSESVKVAVHINNRIKIKEMNTTPFEIYKGWKPNIVYLKRFGSEAYVHIRKEKRKMEPKAHKGIMMGYSMIRKGYRIYLPEIDEIHEVSDVKFNESKLGYYLMNNSGRNLDENELFPFSREDLNLNSHGNEDSGGDVYNKEDQVENFNIDDAHIPQDDNYVDLNEIEEIPPDEIITPRRRGPEPGMTREMRKERDLRLRETEEEELIKRGENVSDRTYEIKCPKDYQEALNSDNREQWIKAMEDEMQRITKLKVWKLIDKPKDKKLIKKSELKALSEGIKELIWTCNIIREMKINLKDQITVYCDSQNSISMIKSKNMKASKKYLNRKCHFIRQIGEDEEIEVLHIPSEEMKADHLTKTVNAAKLKNCISGGVIFEK